MLLREPPNTDIARALLPSTIVPTNYFPAACQSENSARPLDRHFSAAGVERPPAAQRVLAAALGMTDAVYDTFQIRSVAFAARVSPATLYRHFPSKDDLLVACLESWLSDLVPAIRAELNGIIGPVARMRHVSARITVELIERPLLADAFVRSHLALNSTAPGTDAVRSILSSVFALAIDDGHGNRSEMSEMITDIWAVNMPGVVQRRIALTDLQGRLERSVFAVGLRLAQQRDGGAEAGRPT